ncbi:aspartate kinase [Alkalicoccus urumqiensis]|uniref:Aspartokinase n=1 Tax=Alkalicoccus urumqiensis TaxID=1548213 RepID=A0A2P6MFZ1_ALKUR|nr:aspartate kinase [Alkalicoccus urumqiensis]PRO65181.1 aspartate kinase [Alkalicoccus urumqiensis]
MNIIVQKFGGSSLQTEERRSQCAEHTAAALRDGYKVVVVVSAVGRRGDPYATDTLLSLTGTAETVSAKEKDLLMSCGESISAVMFSSLLNEKGIRTEAMSGGEAGFRTSDTYGDARITDMKTDRLRGRLEELDCIVVTGFQGWTVHGTTATLGRGGSDTSAAALGAALNAAYVDIFTDVNGVMTADPRIVKDAVSLKKLTYAEVSNMAYQGAKVIHPRAVEIAMQSDIPLRVRSTWEDGEGTMITSSSPKETISDTWQRPVTAVTHVAPVSQLKVTGISTDRLFGILAEKGISVDFLSIHPDFVTFTVPESLRIEAEASLQMEGADVRWKDQCAKVACVGAGMSGMPGIAASITKALAQASVPILQSADSHTTIWVLTAVDDMERAVQALHGAFLTED